MVTLRNLRYNIIDIIMRTDDAEKLRDVYNTLTAMDDTPSAPNLETDAGAIKTIKLKHGVSLESIRKNQNLAPLSFQEIIATDVDGEWDQSVQDLLNSID